MFRFPWNWPARMRAGCNPRSRSWRSPVRRAPASSSGTIGFNGTYDRLPGNQRPDFLRPRHHRICRRVCAGGQTVAAGPLEADRRRAQYRGCSPGRSGSVGDLLDHCRHDALISVTGAPARAFTLYIAMKIRGYSLLVCLGLLGFSAARGQQYTIQTLTGNGSAGYAGDNGDPAAALLSSPNAVALDSKGNLYIADTVNQRIRMISGRTITTFAGTGTIGYTGDKAAATAATFSLPSGLAFDSAGNLYIADTGNNVIRKISGSTITTVAGNQAQGPNYGGDLGPANGANLWGPTAVAFDSAGNYYIADNGNSLIRKVDTSGIITTTFVGASGGTSGTAGKLDHPNGLWFDASGAVYIADSNNARVARYRSAERR